MPFNEEEPTMPVINDSPFEPDIPTPTPYEASGTDLTGTKWIFNKTLSGMDSDFEYIVTFTCNEINYDEFYHYAIPSPPAPTPHNDLSFGIRQPVYDAINQSWYDESYRLIEITGGSEVASPLFNAWIEANATQVDVLDLSNTSWEIISTTCSSGYGGYVVNFSVDGFIPESPQFMVFDIGYYFDNSQSIGNDIIAQANSICYWYLISSGGNRLGDNISANSIITFISGTDVSNPDLIVWLSQNATYQAPQPIPGSPISIGNQEISKVYWGNNEVLKIYYGNYLLYESSTPPSPVDGVLVDSNGNYLLDSNGNYLEPTSSVSYANFILSNNDNLITSDNNNFKVLEEN